MVFVGAAAVAGAASRHAARCLTSGAFDAAFDEGRVECAAQLSRFASAPIAGGRTPLSGVIFGTVRGALSFLGGILRHVRGAGQPPGEPPGGHLGLAVVQSSDAEASALLLLNVADVPGCADADEAAGGATPAPRGQVQVDRRLCAPPRRGELARAAMGRQPLLTTAECSIARDDAAGPRAFTITHREGGLLGRAPLSARLAGELRRYELTVAEGKDGDALVAWLEKRCAADTAGK